MNLKPKILFLHEIPKEIDDGLHAALRLLEDSYDITWCHVDNPVFVDYDFVLAQGSFSSKVHQVAQELPGKKGLLIAGTADPNNESEYEVIWYENEWYKPKLSHSNIYHGFGVNTDVFKPLQLPKLWDFISVGSFSLWKRHNKIINKDGLRLVIGQIQQNNLTESMLIIAELLQAGVMVSDMVTSKELAAIYNLANTVFIPAQINGGGERAVLEARACGVKVDVEDDNPKLQEYLTCPIYDHVYFAEQLKKGINSVL